MGSGCLILPRGKSQPERGTRTLDPSRPVAQQRSHHSSAIVRTQLNKTPKQTMPPPTRSHSTKTETFGAVPPRYPEPQNSFPLHPLDPPLVAASRFRPNSPRRCHLHVTLSQLPVNHTAVFPPIHCFPAKSLCFPAKSTCLEFLASC